MLSTMNNNEGGSSLAKRRMPFIRATFDMTNSGTYEDAVGWNLLGTGIEVRNVSKFCDQALPHFFRHSNLASFMRQLNLYDFKKGLNKVVRWESQPPQFETSA